MAGAGARAWSVLHISALVITDSIQLSQLFSFMWCIPCFQRIELFRTHLVARFAWRIPSSEL